jgi:hypothetical protein
MYEVCRIVQLLLLILSQAFAYRFILWGVSERGGHNQKLLLTQTISLKKYFIKNYSCRSDPWSSHSIHLATTTAAASYVPC